MLFHRDAMHALLVVVTAGGLVACGDRQATTVPADRTSTTNIVAQPTVPAPQGDSAIKPADTQTRQASEGTEKASSANQSTVGTAASGAPPYTLNGAPEANAAPKDGAAPKK